MKLWGKVDSAVLRNFHDYWEDPLINRYLGDEASKKFEGLLLLRKNKKPIWISHPFNYKQAKAHFRGKAEVMRYNSMSDITDILQKHAGKAVGYNPRHQTVTSFKNLKRFLKGRKLINVEAELEELREIKRSDEIANIARAVRETRKAIRLAKKWLKIGMTEKELDKRIRELFDRDGFGTAFTTVAFGENTSHIHHSASQKKLAVGPVLIDIGAKYNGYCADLTETFYFGAKSPAAKKSKAYAEFNKTKEMVEECLQNIESILKPKTSAQRLWKATQMLGNLSHALGHGIGLEVHDFPSGIGQKSKFELAEGMVIAVEPGVYNKNFGVRIENDYLITKNGFRKLG